MLRLEKDELRPIVQLSQGRQVHARARGIALRAPERYFNVENIVVCDQDVVNPGLLITSVRLGGLLEVAESVHATEGPVPRVIGQYRHAI